MEPKTSEYDSNLGGSITLQNTIKTYHYAAKHIKEIKELINNIQCPNNTKLIFQSLPKHMRRRAMSHYPKRLPRKYRNIHKTQMMKAGKPQQHKRPSRKYRRKPSNLMKEYIRRQRKNIWLETHIWHAKRFHMINKWGYKLAYKSCSKTYRACYRASDRHCLLHDISYYGCIEIKGNIDEIKKGFSRLTNTNCGLSITAKAYLSGKREGSLHLFKIDQYPREAITKINFMWKSCENNSETNRLVWIFVHPTAYKEVLEELIKVFNLISDRNIKIPLEAENDNTEITSNNLLDTDRIVNITYLNRTTAYVRAPHYKNDENSISVTELKDTINRFRLTGCLSQTILCQAFKCALLVNCSNETNNWFTEYIKSDENIQCHTKQLEYWEKCYKISSSSELIPNMIIGLNIEDPRINRPCKRTKAIPTSYLVDKSIYYEIPEKLNYSSIWDSEVREKITNEMMSNHDYCMLRNKNVIVPGERCNFENKMQPIPIILIQRPGSQNCSYKRLGYGGGWDIIIPSGYGMSFWLSLIMWGARPGGLKELNLVNRELGVDNFLPDTISGKKIIYDNYIELRNKYFRLPPNKRCNFNKLSITSPFRAPLQKLTDDWNTIKETKKFCILREKSMLNSIIEVIKKDSNNFPIIPENCLIQISIKIKTRGNPGNFSIICLPNKTDLKNYFKQIYKKDHNPVYVEPLSKDKNETKRKKFILEHKNLLKRLRRRRVREKRKLQETSELKVKIRPAQTNLLVSEHFKKICEMWLKENPDCIRNQCTREVFGYVTECDFSFTEATVAGVGYIVYDGLKKLMKVCKGYEKLVLVRGTKSHNYRFATIKINSNL